MSTLSASSQRPLLGEERPTLDGKNRITIRAEWREIIGGNEVYMMPSSDERCLKVLPPNEMDRLRAFADSLTGTIRTDVQRKIGFDSRCVRWDAQGRCVLPDEFCKRLNLEGEVVITAANQYLEIWNVNNWAPVRAGSSAGALQPLRDYGI